MPGIPDGTAVTIETRWTPPVTVPLGGVSTSAAPGLLSRFLRPKITIVVAGQVVKTIEPAGAPGPSAWPTVRLALIGAAVLLGLVLLRKVAR